MKRLEYFTYIFIGIFITVLISVMFIKEHYEENKNAHNLAINEARAFFTKDLDYRLWASHHGGVYVPITETTYPNPYLSHIFERDIQTPSGKKLTLVNPAYMLRQVFEFSGRHGGVQEHITSLNPLNPKNKSDEWESKALSEFSKKMSNENIEPMKEISEMSEIKGQKYLRYIAPLKTEKSCLKCHAIQGYKEGDIRGGISVSLPWKPYEELLDKQNRSSFFIYLLILSIFVFGLFLVFYIRSKSLIRESRTKEILLKEQYLKDYTKELVCWVDEHTNLIFNNEFFSKVLHYSDEEVRSLTLGSIYHNLSLDKWRDLWIKISKESILNEELEFKTKNSILIPVNVTFTKIEFNKKVYICLIGRDLSEKKQYEKDLKFQNERYTFLNEVLKKTNEKLEQALLKADESNQLKTNFLKNISHEFRTPLNGVIGFSNILSESKNLSGDEIKEYNLIIQNSGTRLLDMINNIIDISQISVGTYSIIEKSFSLNNLTAVTLSNFKMISLQKSLKLNGHCHLPRGRDFFVSDELKIRKVLWHLVGNALKFTEKGSVSFGYTLDNDKLEFFVEDTGPGLRAELQEKIEDLFKKEKDLILKSYDGSSIGLTLCKSIVSILDGEIVLQTKESGGLKIYFSFKNKNSSPNNELDF